MASNDHDDEDMAKALAYIEHMLLDYDDELEEDVHAEENEQLAVKIQEFEAFLLGTDAIAAEQPQPEQGSFFYGNHAVPRVPSLQEPAALHAQEVIAAQQGMPLQQQELGLDWFCGNYVPPRHFIPFHELCSPHHLGSYYGIHNFVPHHHLPTIPKLPTLNSISRTCSLTCPASPRSHAAQGMPQLPQQLELGSFHGIGTYVPHYFPAIPSLQRSIQFQEQPELELGSFDGTGNYVPPALPPVPSLRNLIQICSNRFQKFLSNYDVTTQALKLMKCDVERHVWPLLNGDEDLIQGIWLKMYDIAGNEYSVQFKTAGVQKIHMLTAPD
ncbi:PREDICTED: putative B3 domain-containing [Prunus dulcis]|uniref:PREDICTED: putative B3 domain-containing n=1 Tax=Prunus dulcis TaxID=3755 RepID=A0A5E4E262_PRUDU|nr:PREDICTED: putative B3 domain-containing [Prunus dulcis]